MQTTLLSLKDALPLTCSRAGTCCHGNLVRLNPWELAQLASAKGIPLEDFQKTFTIAGGSILHFNGKVNRFGKKACGLYKEGVGCSVHPSRPLACRLFPVGRQIQNGKAQYIFQGSKFPCLNECPEVVELPSLTVEDYLVGQQALPFENAQDEYLELMQNSADIALSLLLDTGLAASGDTKTISYWRKLGKMHCDALVERIGSDWMNILMRPNLEKHLNDPVAFARLHNEYIQNKAQELIETLSTFDLVSEAAELMMAMALFLAHALGADVNGLAEHWVEIALENGAEDEVSRN